MEQELLAAEANGEGLTLRAAGSWTARNAADIDRALERVAGPLAQCGAVVIRMDRVTAFDTYGACLLERLSSAARAHGIAARVDGLDSRFAALQSAVDGATTEAMPRPPRPEPVVDGLVAVGRSVAGVGQDLHGLLEMTGAIIGSLGRVVLDPRSFRLTSTVNQIDLSLIHI